MVDTIQQSSAKHSGEPALTRLSDRESVRTLALVQRMILEQINRSDPYQLDTLWSSNGFRKLVYHYDRQLTYFDEMEKREAEKSSLSDATPDDEGGSHA
jgi:hypothetical protein